MGLSPQDRGRGCRDWQRQGHFWTPDRCPGKQPGVWHWACSGRGGGEGDCGLAVLGLESIFHCVPGPLWAWEAGSRETPRPPAFLQVPATPQGTVLRLRGFCCSGPGSAGWTPCPRSAQNVPELQMCGAQPLPPSLPGRGTPASCINRIHFQVDPRVGVARELAPPRAGTGREAGARLRWHLATLIALGFRTSPPGAASQLPCGVPPKQPPLVPSGVSFPA